VSVTHSSILRKVIPATALSLLAVQPCISQNGNLTKDEILVGFHYGDMSNQIGRDQKDHPLNIWPFFEDYLTYMEDELLTTSYADFWRWWFVLERYKGDEKGLEELDKVVDACLERGIKVKIDLCWSTWWINDKDWEEGSRIPVGPQDVDDWIHLCDLLGRRFKGRIGMWDLQGEANDLKGYWQGRPNEYVHEIYKQGYRAFKRVDPGCLIGVSGASPSVSREDLDKWYWSNISNCAGFYDNIPINYFADVADPYKGAIHYHDSVRGMLDKVGQKDTEVGMGESSVQWAETTEKAATDPLNMEAQARRLNEVYGQLFDVGMNKFINWATEFAPGGGHWPWRWGFRNYEDWWGIWPEDFKVPGTQIVYKYKSKDGKEIDLRGEWARPADPYYPTWEIHRFWSEIAPPGGECVRIPMTLDPAKEAVWKIAGYQRSFDQVVGLVFRPGGQPAQASIDLTATGWMTGAPIVVTVTTTQINFRTGEKEVYGTQKHETAKDEVPLRVELPERGEFVSISVEPAPVGWNALFEGAVWPKVVEVGEDLSGFVVLQNTGGQTWRKGEVVLAAFDSISALSAKESSTWDLPKDVAPGEKTAIEISLPAGQTPGRFWNSLRLKTSSGDGIGPFIGVASRIVNQEVPRKLVAYREVGQIRLKWFAPVKGETPAAYELERAEGFDQPFTVLAKVEGTEYIDRVVTPDKAYYYRVAALNSNGKRSQPGNEDNAKAITQPRILDAEIVSNNVPARIRIGDVTEVSVTIKNTGTKTWRLNQPEAVKYWFQPTQLWGIQNEAQLAKAILQGATEVKTGDTVTVSFPYVGRKPGRYENHWIVRMEVPEAARKKAEEGLTQHAYVGTPLLVETVVEGK
jgi:hypothetical protein